MNKDEFLKIIRKKILYIFDRNKIIEELEIHIEDSILDLEEEGYSNEEAEKIAVEQMGDPNIIGKLLNKQHNPVIGYCLLVSRVCLICLLLPFTIVMGSIIWDSFEMLTPMKVEDTVEYISLDIELEFPTHKLIIDNICHTNLDSNHYYITYRSWQNYGYSRNNINGSSLFYISSIDDPFLMEKAYAHHGIFGSYGCIEFEMPKDKTIYIHTIDEEIIKINLEEYSYE